MKARHGFYIIERRDGHRINHYPHRTAKDFEVAKYRIVCLARDIRLKYLPERTFEVWDGIDAICKMIVSSSGEYRIIPYLLPTETYHLDKDRELTLRNPLKNQNIGIRRGDVTSWIKAAPMEHELLTKCDKNDWTSTTKTTSRRFGA